MRTLRTVCATAAAVVMLLSGFSYALTAPYLISATALSDSSVGLSWRNNDIATTGFIIQRKDSTETAYHFVDSVKSAAQLSYTDLKELKSTTLYTYQVVAYNASELSDTSNSVEVTTSRAHPSLISAIAMGRDSVRLNWRDKGKATSGYIIQRKDSTETLYHFIDSIKSATIATYTDANGLRPGTQYNYRVIAYDAMNIQDTSNNLAVTTPPAIFNKPSIVVSWNFETSTFVQINISDNANCEIGYRIYRDDGFTSNFNLIASVPSAHPDSIGPINWSDNTIVLNQWYSYKVEVYKNDSSIYSSPCSTFTLHTVRPERIVKFQKLSDYPIAFGGISAMAGDSIILKENPSPAGKYTAINVENPVNPKFDGYVDSTALMSYPLQTLIPAFLQFGISNSISGRHVIQYKDKMLIWQGNVVSMYQIQSSNLTFVDSIAITSGITINQMMPLNDSVLAVIADSSWDTSGLPSYYPWSKRGTLFYSYPAQMTDAGFLSFPRYLATSDYSSTATGPSQYFGSTDTSGYLYIHGSYNGTTLNSTKRVHSSRICFGSQCNGTRDSTASIVMSKGTRKIISNWSDPSKGSFNSKNTGNYFSPTENLCTIGDTALFVSDIRELPDGYHTALINNAIYLDAAAGSIRNLLLDTLNKKLYLFYSSKLSILSYQDAPPVGVVSHADKASQTAQFKVISGHQHSGVTIVLPARSSSTATDLFFYDISGRMVDKITAVTSNAVRWRPKVRSMGCYIVSIKRGAEKYTAKFMTR
jgi:hypothetical protein